MSNEPPEPGASEPESPQDPPTRPLPSQTPPAQTPPPQPTPPQPPPGYPPPPSRPPYPQPGPPPYGQPGPYGAPPQPGPYGQPPHPYGQPPQQGNPYAQPQQPPPTQPVWQGHQAPLQQYPPPYGWPGQAPVQPQRRRGLLIGLLVVLALALVGTAIVAALLLTDDSDSGVAVKDISPGDCLVGSGLADADEEISDIETIDCGDDHDAEVFATFELAADQDLDAAGSQCVDEAADAGRTLTDLQESDLEIRPLVASDSPDEGDKVVCFIRHPDGSSLSGSEFE